ncbi:MAG: hypothetical protein ACLU3I_00495 [Acutalibacteraceae bacterium]
MSRVGVIMQFFPFPEAQSHLPPALPQGQSRCATGYLVLYCHKNGSRKRNRDRPDRQRQAGAMPCDRNSDLRRRLREIYWLHERAVCPGLRYRRGRAAPAPCRRAYAAAGGRLSALGREGLASMLREARRRRT